MQNKDSSQALKQIPGSCGSTRIIFFGGSLYFLLQTLFGSHRSFIQLLFLVITGAMSCQAGASAGQVWAEGARDGCLERQERELGRRQPGQLQRAGAAHKARRAGSRAWGVSGKRLGELRGFREQDS